VVIGILALVVAVVCFRLGMWQFDRAGVRAEDATAQQVEQLAGAAPVPIEEVLAPQAAFTSEDFARRVALTGRFDPERQFVVPQRHVDGEEAALVVTAFVVTDGPHEGAVMPVLRGWLPESEVWQPAFETGGATGEVSAPDPPGGEARIVGMLNSSEAARHADLPAGAQPGISAGQLANDWGGRLYSAYLVLEEPAQPGGLSPAPSPLASVEGGINLQSLAYAIEWWVFGLFAVFFWAKVFRDDIADLRRRDKRAPQPAAPPVPSFNGRQHEHTG